MIAASGLRAGMVVKFEGELFRIINAEYHAGGGKMPRWMHIKLRSVSSGAVSERRLHPDEKVEDVTLDRQVMEYIYDNDASIYFMNPETFEQISVPRNMIGKAEKFLQPNMRIPVDLYDGQPVQVIFPEVVELKVVFTAPGLKEQETSAYKAARLENGMEVLVPQFIKEGEIVRINVETGKYVERVKK